MTTRASVSPLWRLRVAVASAASSAWKMISLSTPFSRDTASTIINTSLPIISFSRHSRRPESGDQPGPLHAIERQIKMLFVHFHHDVIRRHIHQPAGKILPPQQRRLHLHLDRLADEPPEVLRRDQRPIEAGRRHLQGVLPRQRILDVEQRGKLPADSRAVVHVHARGAIYIHPQRGAMVAPRQLHVHEIKAQGHDTGFEQFSQIRPRTTHNFLPHKTKVGARPTSYYLLLQRLKPG